MKLNRPASATVTNAAAYCACVLRENIGLGVGMKQKRLYSDAKFICQRRALGRFGFWRPLSCYPPFRIPPGGGEGVFLLDPHCPTMANILF